MAGTTTLVSVNAAGTGTGNAQSVYPAMTSDGRYVAFQSNATNLTADSVTRRNIFLRDLLAGTTTLVSPGDNDWLVVKLVGTRSNRDGIGARVRL